MTPNLSSEITCPRCDRRKVERMTTDVSKVSD